MKRAIIFRATGGIGQVIANESAVDGWSLYLHYNNQEQVTNELANQLMSQFPKQDFIAIKLDLLANNSGLQQFCKGLLPVNVVIFTQEVTNYGFFREQDLDSLKQEIQINLVTPLKLTRLLGPCLLKYKHSRIIYLGSVYGGQASALEPAYSASKAALTRFSRAYAREAAASGSTVNALVLGAVDTPIDAIFSDDILDEVKSEIPAGRLAPGKDMGFWVKSILQPESDYLTRQTIYITGGRLI